MNDSAWPRASHFNRAMMALDAEDHFSDRHDPEALLGEDFVGANLGSSFRAFKT